MEVRRLRDFKGGLIRDYNDSVKKRQSAKDSITDVLNQIVRMKEFQERIGSLNMGCIIMNPQNGEIYAMSSYPEYDLNDPWELSVVYSEKEIKKMTDKEKSDALNQIWRNFCISDAFEPGSTYKPVTVAACLDEGVTNPKRGYVCDGFQQVAEHKIKCTGYAKGGHGTINICQALMESCNDVMMQLGAEL